jgi:AraC-like DNA-binding protein
MPFESRHLPIGLIRASIVSPAAAFLARAGAPVERLLVRARLPAWVLADPEALVPTSNVGRFLAYAAQTERVGHVGLLSGERVRIETLGVFGRLICRASTVGHALETTVHNHPAYSSTGRMWLVPRGEDVQFCHAFGSRFDERCQQASHYVLMLMLQVIRLGTAPAWRPAEVTLQSAEGAGLRDVEALSSAHVALGQPATSICVPRALLDQRLRPSRPGGAVFDESIEAWRASAPANDFATSIAQVVEMLSWEGYPDLHLTADVLGMNVRTLQRHLAAAGFTHESLVGRARFTTAAALLEETDARILDIALDLGYSDHAHFTRAFRRWAGCSPQEFRRKRIRPDSGPGHAAVPPSGLVMDAGR